MESAGVALGIVGLAGLFSACLEAYQLVQYSIAFDKDYRILRTKFDNQELRLYSWGIACGLTGDMPDDNHFGAPEVCNQVATTLQCIQGLLKDQSDLRNTYEPGLSQVQAEHGETLSLAVERAGETPKSRRLSSLGTFFRRKKQQRELSVIDSARWAIEDRNKFNELVQHLRDFNDDLESLTRLTNVQNRQQIIVEYEIEEIEDPEMLTDLEIAGRDGSDIISETASIRLASLREGSIRTTASLYTRSSASFRTARSTLSVQERLSIELGNEHLTRLATAAHDDDDDSGLVSNSRPQTVVQTEASSKTDTSTGHDVDVTVQATLTSDQPKHEEPVSVTMGHLTGGKTVIDPLPTFKLLAIGTENCGTTDLLTVFTLGYWPTSHRPRDFKDYVTECKIDSVFMKLLLVDTAGEECYPLLRKHKYANSKVILLCFVANIPLSESLPALEDTWLTELHQMCPGVPIILVGIHDPDVDETPTNGRNYEKHQRQLFAKNVGALNYMWCNPITGEGVDDIFEMASRAVLRKHKISTLPVKPVRRTRLSTLFRNLRDVKEETEATASVAP